MAKLNKKHKVSLSICIVALLGALTFFYLPWSKTGTFYGGELYACLCDSNHYLRIENGKVCIYSPGHEDADYYGPYKEGEDGALDCYFRSFDKKKDLSLSFSIEEAYLGRIIVSDDSGDTYTLYRAFPIGEAVRMLDELEVESVTKEGDMLVYRYYDKDHNEIRRDTKKIPNNSSHPTTTTREAK